MALLTPSLCLAIQVGAGHAALHPASAEFFLEVPDVPALLETYTSMPMVGFFNDPQTLSAVRKLLQQPQLSGSQLVSDGLRVLPLPEALVQDPIRILQELESASFSVEGRSSSSEPGALAVFDWKNEELAAAIEVALAGFTQGEQRWLSREGSRIWLGLGSLDPESTRVLATGSSNLASSGTLESASALGEPAGTVFVTGFATRNPVDLLLECLPSLQGSMVSDLQGLAHLVLGDEALHWRTCLSEGVFVTELLQPEAGHPIASQPWVARDPLDPFVLDSIHHGALFASGFSFDPFGAEAWLIDSLAEASGSSPAEMRGRLEATLGFPVSQPFSKLQPQGAFFVHPVKGLGLPKTYAAVPLREADGVLEEIGALAEELARGVDGMKVKSTKYKKVPYLSIVLPETVASLGDLGSVRPAIAVLDDKLILSNGTLGLKKEIRRWLGDDREQLPAPKYPWTGNPGALPLGTTSVVYIDWATQVEAILELARALGGLAEGLPVDLSQLPPPQVFTRHLPPTFHATTVTEDGVITRHEAGFYVETWLGLVGLVSMITEALNPSTPSPGADAPASVPREQATNNTLQSLRTSISVYRIDTGRVPDRLGDLLQPTTNYPQGFLNGSKALPTDAWGHAFRYSAGLDGKAYKLWSLGPDGIDQNGAGDDIASH